MTIEKKGQDKMQDLPELPPPAEKADQVKGGAEPINTGRSPLKPVGPVNG